MAKNKVELECPHCHEAWASITYDTDTGYVSGKDVKVLKGKKKFKDGEDLACTLCDYKYTTWDLFLAIGSQNKK